MAEKQVQEMRERMKKSLEILEEDLRRIRTGRANPALIEDVKINYYGVPTPLKHLATITAPDPDQLVVRPYDPTQKEAIKRGILEANLGLNPQAEEALVRIKIPKLSEERRRELVKLVKERGEEAKVAIRNIRRDTKEALEKMEKEGKLPEDELYSRLEELNEITHEYTTKIDELITDKEKQILTV
ncbi:MAG: ribosome recycling factor [Candidatus Acetothermia bacterium]|nr:ribosome recycling factor [Candidatus Acetothermia bacterium]MDH7505748.1 ribosome recycling factor [Candidatus Acetothermia bacterium]